LYEPLFGGGSIVVREKYGIEKSKSIRDHLPMIELAAIQFSETLARDDIEKNNRTGNTQCEIASRRASIAVSQAMISHQKNIAV